MEEQKISEKLEEEYKEECEIMLKTKLFEDSLCTKFYQQRLEALEKARNEPNYSAFVKILIHEIKIVNLIESNKSKRKIGEINNRIIARVKHFYKVLKTFQDLDYDYRVNEEYYQFCLLCNKPAALAVLEFMMGNFSNQPKLYSLAANWAHMMNDIGKAFFVLREGMKLFPKDHQLYVTAFNLHLNQVKSVFKEKPPTHQKFGNNVWDQTVKDHVDLVLANITEFEHFQDILRTIAPFDFAYKAYNQLLSYLFTHYSTKAKFWHLCALREKQGYHFSTSDDDTNTDHFETRTKYQILNCVAKYKQGLDSVSRDECDLLWYLYLTHTKAIYRRESNSFLRKVCKEAFQQAIDENKVTRTMYEQLITLVDDETKDSYFVEGVRRYPGGINIWHAYVKHLIKNEKFTRINETLCNGILVLRDRIMPIWRVILNYHLNNSNPKIIKEFFDLSTKIGLKGSIIAKLLYLEWAWKALGKEETHTIFEQWETHPREVINKMFKLEISIPDWNDDFLKDVIVKGILLDPKSPEFWTKYLQYYFEKGRKENCYGKYVDAISEIYSEAKKNLSGSDYKLFERLLDYMSKDYCK